MRVLNWASYISPQGTWSGKTGAVSSITSFSGYINPCGEMYLCLQFCIQERCAWCICVRQSLNCAFSKMNDTSSPMWLQIVLLFCSSRRHFKKQNQITSMYVLKSFLFNFLKIHKSSLCYTWQLCLLPSLPWRELLTLGPILDVWFAPCEYRQPWNWVNWPSRIRVLHRQAIKSEIFPLELQK